MERNLNGLTSYLFIFVQNLSDANKERSDKSEVFVKIVKNQLISILAQIFLKI